VTRGYSLAAHKWIKVKVLKQISNMDRDARNIGRDRGGISKGPNTGMTTFLSLFFLVNMFIFVI